MISKEEALLELGLSEKEVKVYIALLMIGQSSVNYISKRAELNRVTTYDVLKYLQEKGYVSYVIKSGIKYFQSCEPSKFLDVLKIKQKKVSSVMKELEGLKSSVSKKPEMQIYEGIKGIKSIFNDIINERKNTLFIGAPLMLEKMQFYFPHFITEKQNKGMFSKVITYDCKVMRKYKLNSSKKHVDIKFINKKITVTKVIYGNKVAQLAFDDKSKIGLLIENKEISDNEKMIFDILWESSNE